MQRYTVQGNILYFTKSYKLFCSISGVHFLSQAVNEECVIVFESTHSPLADENHCRLPPAIPPGGHRCLQRHLLAVRVLWN